MVDFESGIKRFGTHVIVNIKVAGREAFIAERKFLSEEWDACARTFYIGSDEYDICGKNVDHLGLCGPQIYAQRVRGSLPLGTIILSEPWPLNLS